MTCIPGWCYPTVNASYTPATGSVKAEAADWAYGIAAATAPFTVQPTCVLDGDPCKP